MPTPKPAVRPAAARRAPRKGPGRDTASLALKALPQVHQVLEGEEVRAVAARHGRALVAALLRERLAELRAAILAGDLDAASLKGHVEALPSWASTEAAARTSSTLRPVVNATGVILHTNLGRAILSSEASRRLLEVAGAYNTLEYDVTSGRRGSRSSHLDRIAPLLFPGRALHVVNNNAAAVLLALNTLGEGKEVVVSRGELVEIGGSFRIPDVMRKSGAILREVGTTNKTRLKDYERAIGPRTGLLLKVHPSNYRIVGFTAEVPLQEVAALAKRRRIPVLMDQGSGVLLDLAAYGISGEPSVQEALLAGADVVCCSGDKVLGGPQAGLLVGRPDLIRKMRENPLARALRVDKMTCAALEATLLEYVRGAAAEGIPVVRMIAARRESIEARVRSLIAALAGGAPGGLTLAAVPGVSVLGGGSAPAGGLPTVLIAVTSATLSARVIEERLRGHATPVIARIEDRRVLLDLRTVPEEQDRIVEAALRALAAGG